MAVPESYLRPACVLQSIRLYRYGAEQRAEFTVHVNQKPAILRPIMLRALRIFGFYTFGIWGLYLCGLPVSFAQQPAQKITPYSLLAIDTVPAYRYAWRCGNGGDTCRSFSVFAPEQNFERLQFISPQGEKITIPLEDYLGSEKVLSPRAYAALPSRFLQPNVPIRSIRRMGYRKLAPLACLGDVRIGDVWMNNVLVFQPIVLYVGFMTPEGKVYQVPVTNVQAWRHPVADTALYTPPRVVESQQRLRLPTVDAYVEVGVGVARNLKNFLFPNPNDFGWLDDHNLASVYCAGGVSLWNRFSVGLRQGFEIPFARGRYTPNNNWYRPDRGGKERRQLLTAHTLIQARYLNSDKHVFYSGTLLFGLAYSRMGADTWFELSNGMSIRLFRNTFLLLDVYFFIGENGEDWTVHYGPGIRAGVTTLIPVWRGARNTSPS
jgi:hypothetical protein